MIRSSLLLLIFPLCFAAAQGSRTEPELSLYFLAGGPFHDIAGYPRFPTYESKFMEYPGPICHTYWGKIMLYWGVIGIGSAYTGEIVRHDYMTGKFNLDGAAYDWTVWKRDALSYFPIIIEGTLYHKKLSYGNITVASSLIISLWAKGQCSSGQYQHPYRRTLHYCTCGQSLSNTMVQRGSKLNLACFPYF